MREFQQICNTMLKMTKLEHLFSLDFRLEPHCQAKRGREIILKFCCICEFSTRYCKTNSKLIQATKNVLVRYINARYDNTGLVGPPFFFREELRS